MLWAVDTGPHSPRSLRGTVRPWGPSESSQQGFEKAPGLVEKKAGWPKWGHLQGHPPRTSLASSAGSWISLTLVALEGLSAPGLGQAFEVWGAGDYICGVFFPGWLGAGESQGRGSYCGCLRGNPNPVKFKPTLFPAGLSLCW